MRHGLATICLAIALAAPAQAAAPWSAQIDVPSSAGARVPVGAAFAPTGRGLLTWSAGNAFLPPTRGSLIASDGSLGPGRVLSRNLGIDSIGFSARDRVFAVGGMSLGGQRTAPAFASGSLDSGLEAARRLTRQRVFSWATAASSAGGGAVALQTCTSRRRGACRPALDLTVRRPGRPFSRPVRLADPERGTTFNPVLTMNERGDVLVAWGTRDGVFAQIRLASGRMLAAERLTRRAGDGILRASLSETRHAIVTWDEQRRGEAPSTAPASLFAAVRAANRFGRARRLERFEPAGELGESFPVEVEHTGADRALLAWNGQEGNRRAIRVSEVRGATIGAPEMVSAPGSDAIAPELALGSRGDAIVLWQVPGPLDDLGRRDSDLVAAAREPRAALFGPPEEAVADVELGDVALAVNPVTGGAVVAWSGGVGFGAPLRVAFRSPPAP